MTTRVPDTLARSIRGGGQGSVAYALDTLLDSAVHMSTEVFGAVLVLLSVAVAVAQNFAENRGWIPAVLKDVKVQNTVPVVDEAPVPAPAKKAPTHQVNRPPVKKPAKKPPVAKKTTSGGRQRAAG